MASKVLIGAKDDVVKTIRLYLLTKALISDIRFFIIDISETDYEEDERTYFKTKDVAIAIEAIDRHFDSMARYSEAGITLYVTLNNKQIPVYYRNTVRSGVYREFYNESRDFLRHK